MRSTSPSSWLCIYALVLCLLGLPQSVSAQRPRRMHLRQQRQLDELEKPEVVQPTACIETQSELLDAIGDYYGSEEANITDNSAALTYGWPIEDWCLSSDVVKTFDEDSNSTFTDSLSDAVLNVTVTQEDEVFAEDLIINWSTSVSRTLCTTVCPNTNAEEEESHPEQYLEQQEDQTLLGGSTMEQPLELEQQDDQPIFEESPLVIEKLEDQTQSGDSVLEDPPEQEDQTLFGDSPLEQEENETLFGNSTVEEVVEEEDDDFDETLLGESAVEHPIEQEDETLFGNSAEERPVEQEEDQTLHGESIVEHPIEQEEDSELLWDDYLEDDMLLNLNDDLDWNDNWDWNDETLTLAPEEENDNLKLNGDNLILNGENIILNEENEIDQKFVGDSSSESSADATNTEDNQESVDSNSSSSGSKNETTVSMLIRLIPVKLVCILALTCLFLGVRQMSLSAEGDNGYCCCCKMGCYMFGFGSGGHTSYEGIDPSNIANQKVVEFELLQLEADGDIDNDIDVVIM